jgi:hypothetical protein
VSTVHQPMLARHDEWSVRGIASRLGSAWLLAGLGVIILASSMVLMARSAPGPTTGPAPRHPAVRGSRPLPPGPVPGLYPGRELRPAY